MMSRTEEWITIEKWVQSLKFLQPATEVSCGSKYATIDLVLLLRAEIAAAVTHLPTDGTKSMMHNMCIALDHRLPATDLYVIAAMLEPFQCATIAFQEYCTEHDLTAVAILEEAVQKHVGDLQPQQSMKRLTQHHERRQTTICL